MKQIIIRRMFNGLMYERKAYRDNGFVDTVEAAELLRYTKRHTQRLIKEGYLVYNGPNIAGIKTMSLSDVLIVRRLFKRRGKGKK